MSKLLKNQSPETQTPHMLKQLLKIVIYILLLVVVITAYQPLMKLDNNYVIAEEGLVDLTDFDFTGGRARVLARDWEYYPEHLYTPQDFQADGIIDSIYENNVNSAEYGTYRVTLLLPSGKTYGMTGRSFLFSTKVYINGELVGEIGNPGDTAEATVPCTNTYAFYFTPQSDSTEIIFQVANFQMEDGGGSFSFSLGEAVQVEQYRMTRLAGAVVVVGALITVTLLFIGMFIFFTNRRSFLFYALLTLMIAARVFLTGDKPIMEFFPSLDWIVSIRAEYLNFILIFVFALLYFYTLYKKLIWKPVLFTALGLSTVYGGIVLLASPMLFGALNIYFYLLCGATGLYALVRLALGLKKGGMERALIFIGLLFFLLAAVNDLIQYSLPVFMEFYDIISVGMLMFVFINMIALTIGFTKTERELDEAKRHEEELAAKTDFYHHMAHDLLTPLTRISTNIQVASMEEETDRERLRESQKDIMLIKDMVQNALSEGRKDGEHP